VHPAPDESVSADPRPQKHRAAGDLLAALSLAAGLWGLLLYAAALSHAGTVGLAGLAAVGLAAAAAADRRASRLYWGLGLALGAVAVSLSLVAAAAGGAAASLLGP
jgi:hypothetical protein